MSPTVAAHQSGDLQPSDNRDANRVDQRASLNHARRR